MELVLNFSQHRYTRTIFNKGDILIIPFNINSKKHDIFLEILETAESVLPFSSNKKRFYSFKIYYKFNYCKVELSSGQFSQVIGKEDRLEETLQKFIFPEIPVNYLIFLSSCGSIDETYVNDEVEIKFTREDSTVPIPEYQTDGAAGFDLVSMEDLVIGPNEAKTIKTGLYLELPIGFELQVRPRSGLAFKNNITVLNSPGTVDSDYRGEVCIRLINHDKENSFSVEKGMRIAQGVINKISVAKFKEVESLTETKRGKNGFGSTGK